MKTIPVYTTNTSKIEVVLDGATTTNPVHVIIIYNDYNTSTSTSDEVVAGFQITTTAVTEIAPTPGANIKRQVTDICIMNEDTVAANVTVQVDIGGTNYKIADSETLSANGGLWVLSYHGQSAAAGGGMTSWTIQGDTGSQTVSDGTTVDIAGGTGITTAVTDVGGVKTVTSNLDTPVSVVNGGTGITGDPGGTSYRLNEGSNLTTTSPSFVDVDGASTFFELTIITQGGPVLIGFSGSIANNTIATNTYLDVYESVSAARLGGDDGIIIMAQSVASYSMNASFTWLATGLGAGSHTFKLQWKVNAGTATMWAGAGTPSADMHPQFWVMEVLG